MKAYIFSIGEPTTKLCIEALESQGIEVVLYQDGSRFIEKYRRLMKEANPPFLRVDADTIINHRLPEFLDKAKDWSVAYGWLWWRQDYWPIAVNYYSPEVVELIKPHLYDDIFKHSSRPEQYMWSLPELEGKIHKVDVPLGIKGYGIRNLKPVKERKASRGQNYDWRWIERLNEL